MNDGKDLERLVKRLESNLAPKGLKVTHDELIYDHGEIIGQIDVTIRGQLGSGEIFWAIECRDRPSDGPAGRDWIQQLMGRRDDFGVQQMIAVSTTGFTAPAATLANEQRIWLREVKTLDDPLLMNDLTEFSCEYRTRTWKMDPSRTISADTENPYDKNLFPKTGQLDQVFKRASDWTPVSVNDLVEEQFDAAWRRSGAEVSNWPVSESVQISGPLIYDYSGVTIQINQMSIPVVFWNEKYDMTLLTARDYVQGEKLITRTGTFDAKTSQGEVRMWIDIVEKADGKIDMTVSRTHKLDDGRVIEGFSAGTVIEVVATE